MATRSKARRVGPATRIRVTRRAVVSRAEFNHLIARLNERAEIINDLRVNQEVQFKRLAQLQAELDLIKRAWEKLRPHV
jgi:hypothetical protein